MLQKVLKYGTNNEKRHNIMHNNNQYLIQKGLIKKSWLAYTTAMVLAACHKHHQDIITDVNTKQVAHMVAQSRAKQLATRDSQNSLQKKIITYSENNPDYSGAQWQKQVVNKLQEWYERSLYLIDFLKKQQVADIGFPIQWSKSHIQVRMAKEWAESHKTELEQLIQEGKYYHGLSNKIAPDQLPVLASSGDLSFWGNENPSVSSILLAAIAAICGDKPDSLPGAAYVYPFHNPNYMLPEEVFKQLADYPFATKHNVTLFGDYQYGGQRVFYAKSPNSQYLFGPEDCSSSVGKATYLTPNQVREFNTIKMMAAYNNPHNEYHYSSVVKLTDQDDPTKYLERIEPGDIYLVKGHTAIMGSKPDHRGNITTLQYNRDIEQDPKLLGGGLYDYNLITMVKEKKKEVYILRPNAAPLHESISIAALLRKIDDNYTKYFPKGAIDQKGDCSIFVEEAIGKEAIVTSVQ